MRTVSLALVLATSLLSVAVRAQEPAPSEIATPPGTTLITEISLSDSDILGMIKQAIPAFAQSAAGAKGEMGVFLQNIDLNTLSEAIQGLKFIRFTQFEMTPQTTAPEVLAFFEEHASEQSDPGWSRILFDSSMAQKGTVEVFTRGGQDFYGFAVNPAQKRAFAFRTVGFVDIPKFASWVGKAAKFASISEMKKPTAPKPAAKPTPKPAPKPAVKGK